MAQPYSNPITTEKNSPGGGSITSDIGTDDSLETESMGEPEKKMTSDKQEADEDDDKVVEEKDNQEIIKQEAKEEKDNEQQDNDDEDDQKRKESGGFNNQRTKHDVLRLSPSYDSSLHSLDTSLTQASSLFIFFNII